MRLGCGDIWCERRGGYGISHCRCFPKCHASCDCDRLRGGSCYQHADVNPYSKGDCDLLRHDTGDGYKQPYRHSNGDSHSNENAQADQDAEGDEDTQADPSANCKQNAETDAHSDTHAHSRGIRHNLNSDKYADSGPSDANSDGDADSCTYRAADVAPRKLRAVSARVKPERLQFARGCVGGS